MQPDGRKLLADILASARDIQQFAQGRRLSDLTSDKMLRSAIYWGFAVIGEAMSQLKHVDLVRFERITEAWKIVGFRNQIIHGYSLVDDAITWDIVQNKLPVLMGEVEAMLK